MLGNYFKIALRSLYRNFTYSFINIFGLAVGITAFVLIALWVEDEISYDRFNVNADRIYRVVENQINPGQPPFMVAVTPAPLGPFLKATFPEISHASRAATGTFVFHYGATAIRATGITVEPSFFEMFTVKFLAGDPKTALAKNNDIILTAKLAQKYFGNDDPIGKVLRVFTFDFVVAGVVENAPENSHFQYEFILPFEIFKTFGWNTLDRWDSNNYYTYVLLNENAKVELLDAKIKNVINKQLNEEESGTDIYLQALTKIHLFSKLAADLTGHGDIQYVYIFSIVAVFVLLIACINFMNLATARSTKRAKEIGMRKVIGAKRIQLVMQFMVESIVCSLAALVFASVFVWLLMPAFNEISGKHLVFAILSERIFAFLFGIALATGIIAGTYPALILSSFKPVKVLKGASPGRGFKFRQALVVFQFAISVLLIAGTVIVYSQLKFIRSLNLGYQKDNVIQFNVSDGIRKKYADFKSELMAEKNILGVSIISNQLPSVMNAGHSDWEGKDPGKDILLHKLSVDQDFIQTFGIEMREGRAFSKDIASDSNAVLLNEEAVLQTGLKDPLNKRWGKDSKIIGVVKDFHFKSAHEKIEPLVIFINKDWYNTVYVKIQGDNKQDAIASLKTIFKKFSPSDPFEFSFLDDELDQLYRSEQRTGTLFNYFGFIAIFISCLGLFGLVMFATEQRTKEIGVRKVHGASANSIVSLISYDFLKLVLIANVISIPATWYVMSSWLNNFAYKIEVSWTVFLVAGIVSVAIAWITVAYQAFEAASANPIKALRSE